MNQPDSIKKLLDQFHDNPKRFETSIIQSVQRYGEAEYRFGTSVLEGKPAGKALTETAMTEVHAAVATFSRMLQDATKRPDASQAIFLLDGAIEALESGKTITSTLDDLRNARKSLMEHNADNANKVNSSPAPRP